MHAIFFTLILAATALATFVPAPAPHASPIPSPEEQATMDARYAAILARGKSARTPLTSSLEKRNVHCDQRFGAAPAPLADALACGAFLQSLGAQGVQCANQMPNPGCQQMVVRGSATAWVCGPRGTTGPCSDAAKGILDVANTCNNGGMTVGSCDFALANMGDSFLLLGRTGT